METSIGSLNDLENSPAPESYTENSLVTDVDTEIKEMSAVVSGSLHDYEQNILKNSEQDDTVLVSM